MAQKTSTNAVMGTYQTRGEDFLHLIDANGGDLGGIDVTGEGWGSLQGVTSVVPATKTLYVDASRELTKADTYTADGSISHPFTTIMGVVNQVIANGDNSLNNLYAICLCTGVYNETVVLEHPALVNLVFFGNKSATFTSLRSATNNSNLKSLVFKDVYIGFAGSNGFVTLTGDANFGTQGISFFSCSIAITTWTSSTPGSQINLYQTDATIATMNLSSTPNGLLFWGERGPATGGTFNVSGSVLGIQRGSRNGSNVILDATASLNIVHGRQDGNVTVNGTLSNRMGVITGAITINSGGTYNEYVGSHSGALTKNVGGNYLQIGTLGAASVMINGSNHSAGIGSPNGVIIGSPGDVYLNLSGGAGTTLWVKESGTATNTGWVGK